MINEVHIIEHNCVHNLKKNVEINKFKLFGKEAYKANGIQKFQF